MASRTPFPCRVVTPEGTVFEGLVQQMLVTGVGGGAGFMDRHTPLVSDLKMGNVRLQLDDDSWKEWASSEGFASVHDSTGLVLIEEAIAFEDITSEMAEAVIAEAEAELAKAEQEAPPAIGETEHADAVYKADVAKAEKAKAWGEHLKSIAAGSSH